MAAVGVWNVVCVGGGGFTLFCIVLGKRFNNSPLHSNLNKSSAHRVTHDGVSGFNTQDWTGEG